MKKRIEIEVEGVAFVFELDGGVLTFWRGEAPPVKFGPDSSVELDALYVLFHEVLDLGTDLDETEKAFRREEERAGNAVKNWNEDAAMRERENQELARRLRLANERAEATLVQLTRERAKRAEIYGALTCTRCGSEHTAPVFARHDGKPGVIVVCCDCEAFIPWREIEPKEPT